MKKKTGEYSKKIGPQLLTISCLLLLSTFLFSSTVLADNTNVFGKVSSNDKISTSLSSKIAEVSATEQIPVIILLNNQTISFTTVKGKSQIESEQEDLIKFLKYLELNKKVKQIKPMHIVNAVAAKVTSEVIASLSKRPDISKIEPDEVISIAEDNITPLKRINSSCVRQSIAWGVNKIRAPEVWRQGITGKGISVAVLDSGIDATHPDLNYNPSTNNPKVVDWIDYINRKKFPYDDYGHGTHIAGIISGTGASGIRTGVAPGTNLLVAKIFDQSGSGYQSDAILAFEWAVSNGARVISFSGGEPKHNSSFTIAVDKVVAEGVIPVVAAGNSGPGSNTIYCPGDDINSTTVGATDTSDAICPFSSRGPVDLYGQHYIKPDVSAPGIDITSTVPIWYGTSYDSMSGTSVAAPHVAGTVALMLEKNPTLKPSEIKYILESTAVHLGSVEKNNDYGSGRINAYEAVFYRFVPHTSNFKIDSTKTCAPLSM
jgi:serine protease AprX